MGGLQCDGANLVHDVGVTLWPVRTSTGVFAHVIGFCIQISTRII